MANARIVHKFTTPRGTVAFSKLDEPDYKFNKAGQFSCRVRLTQDSFSASDVEKLEKMRDELAEKTRDELRAKKEGAKVKSLSTLPVFTPETDKETGDETGFVVLNAKMTYSGINAKTSKPWTRRPHLFDAAGKPLKKVPAIWGGSVVKLSVEAFAYYTPKDNVVGIAFALVGVQIIKLVSGGSADAASMGFSAEDDDGEGYIADDGDESGDVPAAGGPAPTGPAEF